MQIQMLLQGKSGMQMLPRSLNQVRNIRNQLPVLGTQGLRSCMLIVELAEGMSSSLIMRNSQRCRWTFGLSAKDAIFLISRRFK